MEIYFSFTILILNSPSVLPLSKNFLLQDSVSAQIMRVVVAGSKWRRASRSYQYSAPQGPSSSLGSSWRETNFSPFDFMLGKTEHQTYQSVIAQVGKGLTMLVCERVEFALILENNNSSIILF